MAPPSLRAMARAPSPPWWLARRRSSHEVIAGRPGGAWVERAARTLDREGFCVLRRGDGSADQVIPTRLCERCQSLALSRLWRLLGYARAQEVDTVLTQFASREICQRGFCARRYDMDLSEAEPSGVDLEEPGDEAWEEALGTLDEKSVLIWLPERATACAGLGKRARSVATALSTDVASFPAARA